MYIFTLKNDDHRLLAFGWLMAWVNMTNDELDQWPIVMLVKWLVGCWMS